MVRKTCVLGGALLAFGLGLLLASLIGPGWVTVLLGLAALAGGALVLKKG